jgi:hypothetical protein
VGHTTGSSESPARREAFGFAISGCGERWLGGADHAERLELRLEQSLAVVRLAGTLEVADGRARALLADGRVLAVDAAHGYARFHGHELLSEDQLVHPYLGVAAGLASRLHGRDALHAGAFVIDGGAWLLLAGRRGGKSTLLAALSAVGLAVLADDLAVIDDGRVLRGPRCIDLRRPPASGRDAVRRVEPTPLERANGGKRWRVSLPAAAAATALHGFVRLRFGASPSLCPVPPADRLNTIAGHRMWPAIRADPRATLAAAALPMVELERPLRLDRVGDSVERLVECLSGRK